MVYQTKIQMIRRTNSTQCYINVPSSLAHGMAFERGETVEWNTDDPMQLVLRRTSPPVALTMPEAPATSPKEEAETSLSQAFMDIFDRTRPAFSRDSLFERSKTLALSTLLCLGRHTVSGMITTCGGQFSNWSASYRLFEYERINTQNLFDVSRQCVTESLPSSQPFVALLDDTLLKKTGRHVAGASYRRDPLGPKFQTNLTWSQRFLQVSVAVPAHPGTPSSQARAVPIDFVHCPTPRKPSKQATDEERAEYRTQLDASRISLRGAECVQQLRERLDLDPKGKDRQLVVCVDGSYTNKTMFRNLPERTCLIGRIRKDATFYDLPPEEPQRRGRKTSYGVRLPTPEQMRQDPSIPWKTAKAFAAGRTFDIKYKSIGPLLWRSAGGTMHLRLIIIAPLGYRPRAGAKVLYRDPAYLLCSDAEFDEQQIIQDFLWRWEIEVNFREEKTLLGTGEAQVRTAIAAETVPRFKVACYGFLLLANHRVGDAVESLPVPLWQRAAEANKTRRSTPQMIGILRSEVWGMSLRPDNFSGFVSHAPSVMKPENINKSLKDAVLYAYR